MTLFDVPGWSVPDEPVRVKPKKRKRTSKQNFDKVQSATVTLERLMEQLAASPAAETTRSDPKEEKSGGVSADGDRPAKKRRRVKKNKSQQSPTPTAIQEDGTHEASRKKRKKDKRKESSGEKVTGTPSPLKSRPPPEPRSTLTSLQHGMKQSLDGARFRWINEKLYKSDSAHAHAMMREDPAVFDDYHKGFRRQVESWPSNPVSHYISALSSYPPRTVIADLGCGDAALARALIPKGYTVMSFDLVADHSFVVDADIFDRLPLPGSEPDGDEVKNPGQGHAQVVNVVVCALSLMGTNWPNCIREAWRILRPNGELKIAEVASRFTNVQQFQSFVESFGFKHKSTDDSNTHFKIFEFEKTSRKPRGEKDWNKLLTRGDMLKPCEYKRR
ncbi:methyltransferase-domain-containing protein [Russula ochroleuca]|jgi:ribosomal RNA-processing protein 8|uniref:Ribosomal RNA-processing protein 8 n=1 Tax=Russula ochroleuca TaxID=152965 RepID=A0A9P5N1U8_9AGAM|nr:methyltransferase-domain-containing protein [Russula ochroleuca]